MASGPANLNRKLTARELGRISSEEFRRQKKLPVVLVLDNVRSLHNVGSVFRTADAFAVSAIYLCGITGTPPHREIEKTALGATQSVHWQHFPQVKDALQKLRDDGYTIIGIEQTTESGSLEAYQPLKEEKLALVFGNEVNGVSETALDNVDSCLEIPQFGTKHSFNIVVSAGIVLWHLYLKLMTS